MSEEQTTEEVLKLVEKAQAKGTFDITAFAKGQAVPRDEVTAYLDIESAYKLNALNEKMSFIAQSDEYAELEKQTKELADKVLASKVIFFMRGVTQEVIESVTKTADKKYPTVTNAFGQVEDNPEWVREWTTGLLASNIIKIVNAAGEEDERVFTAEEINELRLSIPKEVWDLLIEKMQQLTLAGSYFKGLTDAGFLPKS